MKAQGKITVNEFRKGHPKGLSCASDLVYTKLANAVYEVLLESMYPQMNLSTLDPLKRIAVKFALYFEDKNSDLYLWDTFLYIYGKKGKGRVPFYKKKLNDSETITDATLALWMFISMEMDDRFINPKFPIFEIVATEILMRTISFEMEHGELPYNDELNTFVYGLSNLSDIMKVKSILMWFEDNCYLGNWHKPEEYAEFKDSLEGVSSDIVEYGCRSNYAFSKRTWPVSMYAKEIFAAVLRYATEDDHDPDASAIEGIDYRTMELYCIEKRDAKTLTLRDYNGDLINVAVDSFVQLPNNCDLVATSLASFGGFWHTIGFSNFSKKEGEKWSDYVDGKKRDYQLQHSQGQYDAIINKNNGRRLYYLEGVDEFRTWLKEGLNLKDVSPMCDEMEKIIGKKEPFAVFIEDDGQTSISFFPERINDAKNKFRDKDCEYFERLDYIVHPEPCTPGALKYMIDNKYLSQLSCSSVDGVKRDRKVIQDNIEFIARFYRRDIDW